MRRIGDRRSSVRLEVIGALWGTLEVRKQARVLDISAEGALLAYPVPVLPETVHIVALDHEGHHITVDVIVRHVRTITAPGEQPLYLAGVEFLSIPEAVPV